MKLSACQVLVSLSVLLMLALAIIVFGQRTMIVRLIKDTEDTEQRIKSLLWDVKQENHKVQLYDEQAKIAQMKMDKDKNTLEGLAVDYHKKVAEREACEKLQSKLAVEMEAVQKETTTLEGEFNVSKTEWSNEINKLKQQLEQPSPACAYVKKDTPASAKLCPLLAANYTVTPSKEGQSKKA
ncbi:uncharacterized protein si:ch73-347e22.8 [Alosa sapidissima]|uniref:uncharacterized protein si:ch73-347e22.8 n=1 Tax=Alosa sapidissima TaxID=34773 RepID=UPI001C095006|nr:uncharacterized protein si:ch73-347e22.8 [Alosa sapidissima]